MSVKYVLTVLVGGVLASALLGGIAGRATAGTPTLGAYGEQTHPEPVCQMNAYVGSSVNLDQIFFCTSDGTMHTLYRLP